MPAAFWDSSAIVPLYVTQPSSPVATHLFKKYEMVVWWGTPVEIAAAFSRLLKLKEIDVDGWRRANTLTRRLADNCKVVKPAEPLLKRAVALVEVYDLRAPDALQLAAALEWCEGRPDKYLFVSFDKRLRDAALMSGFQTPP